MQGGQKTEGLCQTASTSLSKQEAKLPTETVRGQEPKERKGLRQAGGRASGPAVPMRSELAQHRRSGQEHRPRRDPELEEAVSGPAGLGGKVGERAIGDPRHADKGLGGKGGGREGWLILHHEGNMRAHI